MDKTPYKFEVIHLMTANYLELYTNSKIHKTEFDILNYVLSVNGNGYEWINGIPQSSTEIGSRLSMTIEMIFEHPTLATEFEFGLGNFESSFEKIVKMDKPMYVYPISKDSLMCNLPNEIEKSWYEALQKFHSILLENVNKLTTSDLKFLKKSIKDLKTVTII